LTPVSLTNNVDALTLVIVIAIGILLAPILWNGGAFLLKAWFIIAHALGAMHFWETDHLIGLVLASLVLVIEPAASSRHSRFG
jgi:hypothetical protein